MTIEKLLESVLFDRITLKEAKEELQSKEKMKLINSFLYREMYNKDPLKDSELAVLKALVELLQILYTSSLGSVISDEQYDLLQERLVDMGIPRLSGSIETNDVKKGSHKYENLRGTLNKVYYLFPDEHRTNKSRKYLDEWIKSTEAKYLKNTGEKIDLKDTKVMVCPKWDGTSATLEITENGKMTWLTRGDTFTNKASDVTHILDIFNDVYRSEGECGIKFEILMSEDNKDKINKMFPGKPYKNSRQIVTAVLNSIEPDFKAEYLYPVPLRIIKPGEKIEQMHPDLVSKFPSLVCKLSDRDLIRKFAKDNKTVIGAAMMRLRTDGVVITILDPKIQKALGRENHINQFEVALKNVEETAYTKVKDVIFECSEFGHICPVMVVEDVVLKGNTISRISLSNKERFMEMDLYYNDMVVVSYDIIPYCYKDDKCNEWNAKYNR